MKNVAGLAVTIKGTSPMNVVTEVKIIGLNLTAPALETASSILCPSSLNLLMVITRTRLAFTTTPLNAIIPRIEKNTRAVSIKKCPNIAPIAPKGITLMITKGCKYDFRGIASNANMINIAIG